MNAARFLTFALILAGSALADAPIGIIGGESFSGSNPSIAYLIYSDGTLKAVSGAGFPQNEGAINSVAFSDSRIGIIGGGSDFGGIPPTAYLVAADGTLTALTGGGFPQTTGVINSVAMNDSGAGIIGGTLGTLFDEDMPPIAYLVENGMLTALSDGTVFPQTTGVIYSVAIADSGYALMGGEGDNVPTAYVIWDGMLTPVSGAGFPPGSGQINSVAITNSGAGIIGGGTVDSDHPPIAYLVASNGTLTALTGFPATGFINSVAMSESGVGLIGGQSYEGQNPPIAYLVKDGTLVPLTGSGFPQNDASINSVAIATSGAGIIGGGTGLDYIDREIPIAYLVAPNGTLTPVSGAGFEQETGQIYSVAITDSGAGLIGGQSLSGDGSPLAYLVAPNGILTALTGAGFPQTAGSITSVAIAKNAIFVGELTPATFGPYSSLANALFALSHVFESHCTGRKKYRSNPTEPQMALLAQNAKPKAAAKKSCPSWTEWTSFFGDYAYQSAHESIPAFSNEIAGVLSAFEYDGMRNVTVGAGLAYAFTYLALTKGIGHASINQEYAFFYAEVHKRHFYFNAALWGGLYQMHNKRHTLGMITSTSNPHGWLLSPHVELSAPLSFSCSFSMDPFVMFDWANSWQKSFREHGESGFNIVLNHQYSSLLRSEVGLRFYETLNYDWGCFKIEEKASYVNKAPFHTGAGTAYFVGVFFPFSVDTFSSSIQNLGVAQVAFYFTPRNTKYPYGALDYQGEFGSSFQSHILVLEIGQAF